MPEEVNTGISPNDLAELWNIQTQAQKNAYAEQGKPIQDPAIHSYYKYNPTAWQDFRNSVYNAGPLMIEKGLKMVGPTMQFKLGNMSEDDFLQSVAPIDEWAKNNAAPISDEAKMSVFDDFNAHSFAGSFGQGIGTMAAIVPAVAGVAVGALLAPVTEGASIAGVSIPSAIIGATAVTSAIGSALNYYPMAFQEARDAGYEINDAVNYALTTTTAISAMEVASGGILGKVIEQPIKNQLFREVAKKSINMAAMRGITKETIGEASSQLTGQWAKKMWSVAKNATTGTVKQFSKGFLTEGTEEFLQSYTETGIKQIYDTFQEDPDAKFGDKITSFSAFQRAWQDGLMGGIIGGHITGPSGVISKPYYEQGIWHVVDKLGVEKANQIVTELVDNGSINQQQAQSAIKDIADINEAVKTVGNTVREPSARYDAFRLIRQKNNLQNELGTLSGDPDLREPIAKKIEQKLQTTKRFLNQVGTTNKPIDYASYVSELKDIEEGKTKPNAESTGTEIKTGSQKETPSQESGPRLRVWDPKKNGMVSLNPKETEVEIGKYVNEKPSSIPEEISNYIGEKMSRGIGLTPNEDKLVSNEAEVYDGVKEIGPIEKAKNFFAQNKEKTSAPEESRATEKKPKMETLQGDEQAKIEKTGLYTNLPAEEVPQNVIDYIASEIRYGRPIENKNLKQIHANATERVEQRLREFKQSEEEYQKRKQEIKTHKRGVGVGELIGTSPELFSEKTRYPSLESKGQHILINSVNKYSQKYGWGWETVTKENVALLPIKKAVLASIFSESSTKSNPITKESSDYIISEIKDMPEIVRDETEEYFKKQIDYSVRNRVMTEEDGRIAMNNFMAAKRSAIKEITNPGKNNSIVGDKLSDDEVRGLIDKMAETFGKAWKNIKVREVKSLGEGILGRAFVDEMVRVVEFVVTGGTADQFPHEYAEHFLDMFSEDQNVKEMLAKYGKEGAAQRMAQYAVQYHKDPNFVKLYKGFTEKVKSVVNDSNFEDTVIQAFMNGHKLGVEKEAGENRVLGNRTMGEEFYATETQAMKQSKKRISIDAVQKEWKQHKKGTLDFVSKYIDPISGILRRAHPWLKALVRKHTIDTDAKIGKNIALVKGFVDKFNKIDEYDRKRLELAALNRDEEMVDNIIKINGMEEEYKKLRSVLDSLYAQANSIGYDIGYVQGYLPTWVKDYNGLVEYMYKEAPKEAKGAFLNEINEVEDARRKSGMENFQLTTEEKAEIINRILSNRKNSKGEPFFQGAQAKKIQNINGEMSNYYHDLPTSIIKYIEINTRAIETKKFKGEINIKLTKDEIASALKSDVDVVPQNVVDYFVKMEITKSIPRSGDEATLQIKLTSRINKRLEEVKKMTPQQMSEEFARVNMGVSDNVFDTIGFMASDLRDQGEITDEQYSNVLTAINTMLNPKGYGKTAGIVRDITYVDVLGGWFSALTQIQDIAQIVIHAGISKALKGVGGALSKSNLVTLEDLRIKNKLIEEFSDNTWSSKILNTVFKYSGLTKMDNLTKQSLVNAALERAIELSSEYKSNPGSKKSLKFENDLKNAFGRDYEKIKETIFDEFLDAQNGNISEDVKSYLANVVMDFHPISAMETPVGYLGGGNLRFLYMMKTYQLKLIDTFRRESADEFFKAVRNWDVEKIKEHGSRLAYMTFVLVAIGASVDFMKDWLKNLFNPEPTRLEFTTRMAENLLQFTPGMSKYTFERAKASGIWSAYTSGLIPPARLVDNVSRDVVGGITGGKHSRWLRSVPWAGDPIYFWSGRNK